jgi:Fe-S-cluster-containing dehydrogenase component
MTLKIFGRRYKMQYPLEGRTMKWGMIVDLSKCVRYYGCVVVGRVKNFLFFGHDWTQMTAVEPD